MPTDTERMHALAGECSALRMFATAVIEAFPDKARLVFELARLSENQLANTEQLAVREEFLESQRHTAAALLEHARAVLARDSMA